MSSSRLCLAGRSASALALSATRNLAWLLLAAAFCLAGAAPARADSSVIVLTVRSMDGDDARAQRLSDALRTAAAEVEGWSVSERKVSLAQMSLAHGCESTTASCMADIAKTLEVDRLIYGTSRVQDGGVGLEVHNFDAVTGHIETSFHEQVSNAALEELEVATTATKIAERLAGIETTGTLVVVSNAAGGVLSLDGQPVGPLDAAGERTVLDVPVGVHEVRVSKGEAFETTTVEVVAGATAQADVSLMFAAPAPVYVPEPDPAAEPNSERGQRMWVTGWVMVGSAAALLVTAGGVWGRIGGINREPDMVDYRAAFSSDVTNVCSLARAGTDNDLGGTRPGIDAHVASLCDRGEALEKAQWGLVAGSIATAVVGTTLLVLGLRNKRDTDAATARVTLLPQVSLHEAGLGARLRF